jgi:cytochrome b561
MVRNSVRAWGWPAKLLHWIGAVIILLLLGHGWWMTHMAPRPDRLAHYAGHSALGFDFLVITVLRLLWRWLNPVPADPEDAKPWERWAAHAVHWGLYVLMLIVSLTGWVTANTFRAPITRDIINIPFPTIVTSVDRATRGLFEESHMVLAYVLAVVVLLHILAALRHHWFKRTDVLSRMTWGGA